MRAKIILFPAAVLLTAAACSPSGGGNTVADSSAANMSAQSDAVEADAVNQAESIESSTAGLANGSAAERSVLDSADRVREAAGNRAGALDERADAVDRAPAP